MSVDIVKEVAGLQRAYAGMRGATRAVGVKGPNGLPLILPNTLIPKTTWTDVVLIGSHLQRMINPTFEQCQSIMVSRGKDVAFCFGSAEQNPRAFVHTAAFRAAEADFFAAQPKPLEMMAHLGSAEEFPRNEQFWAYAARYAIARSAAGAVPFWTDIAAESVKEAIEELPDTLRDVFDATVELPGVGFLVKVLKWSAVGAAAFLVYKHFVRS